MPDREKVIKGLEIITGKMLHDCKKCPYREVNRCEEQIVSDALELLKAQEPRTVHVTAEINYRKIGNCPNCGKPINSGDYPNYCGHCGQAVKWE